MGWVLFTVLESTEKCIYHLFQSQTTYTLQHKYLNERMAEEVKPYYIKLLINLLGNISNFTAFDF